MFKGVRHIIQSEQDGFILGADFVRGIDSLAKYNLTYDILIYPKHLLDTIELVNQHPNQLFVIDHMAKPLIKDHVFVPWESYIRKLAKSPNVYCKVSGLITEANWHNWKEEDIKPYIDIVFDAFGMDRVMFGSDWPVCKFYNNGGSYAGIFKELSRTRQN